MLFSNNRMWIMLVFLVMLIMWNIAASSYKSCECLVVGGIDCLSNNFEDGIASHLQIISELLLVITLLVDGMM